MEYLIILLQTLVDGIMIGGVYAVLAIGLSLVFGRHAHRELRACGIHDDRHVHRLALLALPGH